MHWRTPNLPAHDGTSWASWNKGHCKRMELALVLAHSSRWIPQNPRLFAAPGMGRFAPPVAVDTLRDTAMRAVARNSTTLVLMWTALATIAVVLTSIAGASHASAYAILLFALALVFAVDHQRNLRKPADVLDRAYYFYMLRTDPVAKAGLYGWLAFVVAIGAMQLLAQSRLDGLANTVHAYGAWYPRIDDGEYWRLVTGPLLHFTLTHYVVNAALLTVIGWIAWAACRGLAVAVFLVACTGSALAQYALGGRLYDNLGGISGGVFALFAFVLVASMLDRSLLPKGFWLIIGGIFVVGVISSEALNANAATTAHLTGIVIGVLAACARAMWRRSRPASTIRSR